jgi:hypothetical protein
MSSPRPGANYPIVILSVETSQCTQQRHGGYRHPYICTGVRIAAGTWNLVLGSLLLSHGYRWGVALFAVSALIFWAAYIMARGKFESRAQ